MVSLLRTRAARRWLTWASIVLAVIGLLGLGGGFERRTYPQPETLRVGQAIETTRFTYTVESALWAPYDGGHRLTIGLTVRNTSPETSIVPRWLVFVRLPDGTVLPLDGDAPFVHKDGPGRFLPLIEAPATLTLSQGVPAEPPDEVTVLILDETLAAEEGVYSESWQPGQLVAQVMVPVSQGQP